MKLITAISVLALSGLLTGCGSGIPESIQSMSPDAVFTPLSTAKSDSFIGTGIGGTMSPIDLYQHYNIPSTLSGVGTTIAIVDTAGTGNISADCNTFSVQYKLPACNIQTLNLSTKSNNGDPNWTLEVALDVEWAHAMAPNAKIILVTAKSGGLDDMVSAIYTAASQPGVVAVSMSWGTTEWSGQVNAAYDGVFAHFPNVAFFASAGDNGNYLNSQNWPAANPLVTAVGGTAITKRGPAVAGGETGWRYSGGGYSAYETMPTYQLSSPDLSNNEKTINRNRRAIPDVSYNADNTISPVAVYSQGMWYSVGGTSAGAPQWAGIVALWGQYLAQKKVSLGQTLAYYGGLNNILYQSKYYNPSRPAFFDVLLGNNNTSVQQCGVCQAGAGFDDVTGLGEPNVTNFFSYF